MTNDKLYASSMNKREANRNQQHTKRERQMPHENLLPARIIAKPTVYQKHKQTQLDEAIL